jgi:hypothetical protein
MEGFEVCSPGLVFVALQDGDLCFWFYINSIVPYNAKGALVNYTMHYCFVGRTLPTLCKNKNLCHGVLAISPHLRPLCSLTTIKSSKLGVLL